MVIEIDNKLEGRSAADVARIMIGKKTFLGWPFLQEGLVVGVSDSMFRHEERPLGNAGQTTIAGLPHNHMEMMNWKRNAVRIEQVYSKRYAVLTGAVELLLHVRPLKGLKRLDTGALVKDYEGADREVEQAVQLGIQEVASEDLRFQEQAAPPMAEEFPDGSRIIFLGEHAYGVAAQVASTTEDSLTIVIAFFPGENQENENFTRIVRSRLPTRYFQSYDAARLIGISGLALAKITSSLMVLGTDGTKTNLGLGIKFEAKGLKVMDYSKKEGRSWEFSDKTVELVRDYRNKYPSLFACLDDRKDDMLRSSEIFREGNADAKVKEIKAWLASKGVKDFEPVPLATDQLKKEVVSEIEKRADALNANRHANSIKKAKVQNIPRQAVLKPSHAVYRLQNQHFALGDRVVMVQDTGSVPLAAKGVVIGLHVESIDVVWDVPFISGSTLGGRCSEYRGSTVALNSCLNLTDCQYVASTKPPPPKPVEPNVHRGAPGLRGGRGRGRAT
ncbi:hypothetical protein DL93DRAFT_2054516 [Clavulina sp. PMI_390]|nr:hypothetical protein DL93DRAFT_2054516 [Clavulina sp. PMI_390]